MHRIFRCCSLALWQLLNILRLLTSSIFLINVDFTVPSRVTEIFPHQHVITRLLRPDHVQNVCLDRCELAFLSAEGLNAGTLGYKIRLEREMLFLVLTWEHADLHISRVCSVYQNVQSAFQRQNSPWLSLCLFMWRHLKLIAYIWKVEHFDWNWNLWVWKQKSNLELVLWRTRFQYECICHLSNLNIKTV